MTAINDNRIGDHQPPSVKLSNQPAARLYQITQPTLGNKSFSGEFGGGGFIAFCSSLHVAELSESPTLHRQPGQIAGMSAARDPLGLVAVDVLA